MLVGAALLGAASRRELFAPAMKIEGCGYVKKIKSLGFAGKIKSSRRDAAPTGNPDYFRASPIKWSPTWSPA